MVAGQPEALTPRPAQIGAAWSCVAPEIQSTDTAMRNLERFLALALILLGVIGIYAASGLSLWDEFTVGPGAAPIAYASILVACAAFVAAKPSSGSGPIEWGQHFPRAVALLVLAAAMAFSISYIGFTGGLFLFS